MSQNIKTVLNAMGIVALALIMAVTLICGLRYLVAMDLPPKKEDVKFVQNQEIKIGGVYISQTAYDEHEKALSASLLYDSGKDLMTAMYNSDSSEFDMSNPYKTKLDIRNIWVLLDTSNGYCQFLLIGKEIHEYYFDKDSSHIQKVLVYSDTASRKCSEYFGIKIPENRLSKLAVNIHPFGVVEHYNEDTTKVNSASDEYRPINIYINPMKPTQDSTTQPYIKVITFIENKETVIRPLLSPYVRLSPT